MKHLDLYPVRVSNPHFDTPVAQPNRVGGGRLMGAQRIPTRRPTVATTLLLLLLALASFTHAAVDTQVSHKVGTHFLFSLCARSSVAHAVHVGT
jgi:hypothetical protein